MSENEYAGLSERMITSEPYYLQQKDEVKIGLTAAKSNLPLLLKGPTGCGKTRYMQYLAWKLSRPLITVACHDDLSAADLVGRYLVKGGETVWQDGPLTIAVKGGAICYLDEIVEARKDTTVVIHPLTDDRRELPIDKRAAIYPADRNFMLAVSYNPGYQSILKDLKPSTRQRFVSLQFDYPDAALEKEIVSRECGVEPELVGKLVRLACMTRELREAGLPEGASTRLIVQTVRLIQGGILPEAACRAGMMESLTDDPALLSPLHEMIRSIF